MSAQGWSSRQLVGLIPRSRGCESHSLRQLTSASRLLRSRLDADRHTFHQCQYCLCRNATAASRSNESLPGSIHTSQYRFVGPLPPNSPKAPEVVPLKFCHQKNGVWNVHESPFASTRTWRFAHD